MTAAGRGVAYPLEILRCIHPSRRRFGQRDQVNAHTVFERAQLFQFLSHLQMGGRPRCELEQTAHAIPIDADMAPRAVE